MRIQTAILIVALSLIACSRKEAGPAKDKEQAQEPPSKITGLVKQTDAPKVVKPTRKKRVPRATKQARELGITKRQLTALRVKSQSLGRPSVSPGEGKLKGFNLAVLPTEKVKIPSDILPVLKRVAAELDRQKILTMAQPMVVMADADPPGWFETELTWTGVPVAEDVTLKPPLESRRVRSFMVRTRTDVSLPQNGSLQDLGKWSDDNTPASEEPCYIVRVKNREWKTMPENSQLNFDWIVGHTLVSAPPTSGSSNGGS